MSASYTPVIDADGHVMENDREIYEHLPAPYAGHTRLFGYPFFPTIDGWHRAASKARDATRLTSLEVPNAQDWVKFVQDANIAASVLFPTAGLSFGLIKDPDWAAALAGAYNDWLHERFLKADPRRLKGMALIPLQEPERAAAELRRAVGELGMLGGILPAVGLHEAFGHKSFWPVYEAAQELGCVLAVHGAPAQQLGLERLHKLIEARTLTHVFSQSVQLVSMMFGGVFDAFPRLRFALCEAGCGWVPYILERLDLEYKKRWRQAPDLKIPPSEHLKSGRVFIHTELDEEGLPHAIELLGENVFFCASDYPHEPAGEFPEAVEEFLGRTDLSASAKDHILRDNPAVMYGLKREAVVSAPA